MMTNVTADFRGHRITNFSSANINLRLFGVKSIKLNSSSMYCVST